MKFIVFVFLVVLSVVSAQFPFFGFSQNLQQANSLGGRDPRLNTGPVLFPNPPPNAIMESSGVVVGSSGYGFVPPNARGYQPHFIHQRYFRWP